MCIPHFLYPFICQWTFRYYQFPYLGYWEQCCSEQEIQISLQEPDFNFCWIYTQIVGSYGSSYRYQNPNGIFTELEKQLLGWLPQTFFFKINFGEGIIKLQLVYSQWEYKMVYSLWKNGSSTVKNRTTMSILIQVFMWIHVFMSLGDKSGVELQDNMATPCFIFGGTIKLFPKGLHHFISMPAMGSNFFTTL